MYDHPLFRDERGCRRKGECIVMRAVILAGLIGVLAVGLGGCKTLSCCGACGGGAKKEAAPKADTCAKCCMPKAECKCK
jgi:hypothetical protein